MRVFVQKTGESHELSFSGTARDLLERLHINVATVLIVRDGTLITEDEMVDGAKDITLLSVVSGG